VLLAKEKITCRRKTCTCWKSSCQDAQNRFNAGSSSFDVARRSACYGEAALIQARNDYRIAIEHCAQVLGFVTPTAGVDWSPESRNSSQPCGGWQVKIELADALEAAHTSAPNCSNSRASSKPENRTSRPPRRFPSGVLTLWVAICGRAIRMPARGMTTCTGGPRAFKPSGTFLTVGHGRPVGAGPFATGAGEAFAGETTLAVDVQVRQAYSSLVEAWELVQASAKTIDQAQEALRLANVRYGVGTATQLDVLTSQVALTEARLNELQAGYGYNVALATLRQAMGQADEFVTS